MTDQALLLGRMGRLERGLFAGRVAFCTCRVGGYGLMPGVGRNERRLFAGGEKKENEQYGCCEQDEAQRVFHDQFLHNQKIEPQGRDVRVGC